MKWLQRIEPSIFVRSSSVHDLFETVQRDGDFQSSAVQDSEIINSLNVWKMHSIISERKRIWKKRSMIKKKKIELYFIFRHFNAAYIVIVRRNSCVHLGQWWYQQMSRLMTKQTIWYVRPAKTQISLGIRMNKASNNVVTSTRSPKLPSWRNKSIYAISV